MAFGAADAVKVNGLAEFKRDLKALGADMPKQLRQTNLEAAQLVADAARKQAAGQGGVAAKAGSSIKAAATQQSAKLAWGGPKFPFAAGAEFGGGKHGKGNPTGAGGYTTQFQPWRGSGEGAGYFVFPAVRGTREEFIEVYGEMLDDLTRFAFPRGRP